MYVTRPTRELALETTPYLRTPSSQGWSYQARGEFYPTVRAISVLWTEPWSFQWMWWESTCPS